MCWPVAVGIGKSWAYGGSDDWCGITEYIAPVFTKNDRFDSFSTRIKNLPGGPGLAVIAPAVRPTSFP